MDELDKQVKILSILSGTSEERILDLSLSDVKGYIRQTNFIYSTPKSNNIRRCILIGNRRFKIDTDLRINGAEYIDMATLTKEKDQITRNLPQIIAIFLKPINILGLPKRSCYRTNKNGKLVQTIESREATAILVKDRLTMDIVFDLSAFFLKSGEALTRAGLDYLNRTNKKVMEDLKREVKDLGITGHGT